MKDNDLNKAIYQLKQIGYEPQLRYNDGKTSEFIMSLSHLIDEKKKMKKYIAGQSLRTSNFTKF